MNDDRRPVLVTGANGTTGSEVVRALVAAGIPTRVLVRDRAKAASLPSGIEILVGELSDRATLDAACRGVRSVFMASFDHPDQIALQQNLIDACRDADVDMIVRLSGSSAAPDASSRAMRIHAAGDAQLARAGLNYCILKPSWFHQNFLTYCPGGRLRLPAGDGRLPFIDVRDIAAVAVKALTEPGHDGKSYLLLGPELLNHREVADILSKATGRDFVYEDVAPETWRQESVAAGMSEDVATQVAEIFARVKAGHSAISGGDLEPLLGRPGITLAEFAKDHAAALVKQI